MGIDDGAGDGEAHSGAADAFTLALPAVELVEDHLLFKGVDSGAAVGDADREEVGLGCGLTGDLAVGGYKDGLVWWRVLRCVFEKVFEDLVDPFGVGKDVGQAVGERDPNVARIVRGAALGLDLFDGRVDEGRDGLGTEFELNLVVVELGHLNGLFDETIEAVGLLVDDGEKFGAGFWVKGLLREKRGDGCFDRGERGAEFMGDGVEERGAEALVLFGGVGAGGVLKRVGAFDGHRHDARQGLHGLARKSNGFEEQRAGGADADVERDRCGLAFGSGAEDGEHHGLAEVVEERRAGCIDASAPGLRGDTWGARWIAGIGRCGEPFGVGEVDAVAFGEVEGDGGGVEGVGDGGGDEVEELADVLGL